MRKFRKRVILIHELGKRRRTEELFDRRNNRADIDKRLRCDLVAVILRLQRHSFTDHSFHSGKSDPHLILKKFAHCSDSAVAEMVDIISCADPVGYIYEIGNGSEYIVSDDVFRNQFIRMDPDLLFEHLFIIAAFFSA